MCVRARVWKGFAFLLLQSKVAFIHISLDTDSSRGRIRNLIKKSFFFFLRSVGLMVASQISTVIDFIDWFSLI